MKKLLSFSLFAIIILIAVGSQCSAQNRKFDTAGMFLKAFKVEAKTYGILTPENITIKYKKMGTDTLGAAHKVAGGWLIEISQDAMDLELETVVYHCAAHACGLPDCDSHELAAAGDVRMPERVKRRLFTEIANHQRNEKQ
jgi:hypothetical protein